MLAITDPIPTRTFKEKDYNKEVQKLIEYIIKVKESDKDMSILESILDYCYKYDISEGLIGDAISNDTYFKDLIKKDCELHKYIKTEKPEDW